MGGQSQPAVRIEANPTLLNNMASGWRPLRSAVAAQNVNRPKGSSARRRQALDPFAPTISSRRRSSIGTSSSPTEWRAGAAYRTWPTLRIRFQDIHNAGNFNGKPSVLMVIFRQPGANIIATVDRVHGAAALAAGLHLPPAINFRYRLDRTTTHPRFRARCGTHAA